MKYITFSEKLVRENLWACGVPEERHEEAVKSITAGYKHATRFKPIFANLSAPFVVPFALLGSKWEDNKLPEMFSMYDNDSSLNGDRYETQEDFLARNVSLDKDNEFAIANNYWNPGKHPRTYGSRYKWVGLRNRGKMSYMVPAERAPSAIENTWGQEVTRGNSTKPTVTGWKVLENNGYWQMCGCNEFVKGRYQENNWGWKVGIYRMLDNGLVMAVGVNFKLRKPGK